MGRIRELVQKKKSKERKRNGKEEINPLSELNPFVFTNEVFWKIKSTTMLCVWDIYCSVVSGLKHLGCVCVKSQEESVTRTPGVNLGQPLKTRTGRTWVGDSLRAYKQDC